jgi:hypothetical protein
MFDIANPKKHLEQVRELQAAYAWKAANIVRFFDNLGMTTEEKEKFLAQELAGAYEIGALNESLGRDHLGKRI